MYIKSYYYGIFAKQDIQFGGFFYSLWIVVAQKLSLLLEINETYIERYNQASFLNM
jgi:hypothetical protein